jgi:toxin ParE1/3/4
VKHHSIVWRPRAQTDLLGLYDWIAEQADTSTAFDYTSKIEVAVSKLAEFPDRGAPRDDLFAGLRTIMYRRRTIIAYRVLADEVEVLRIVHGGRDLGRMFEEE